jgi:proteasome accessory factor C
MRTFHLDRVSDAVLTDIPIAHAEEPVPGLFEPGEHDIVVRIRFAPSVTTLIGDYLDRAQVDTADGVSIATMRIADEQSLKRLAARLGGDIEILEPAAARRAAEDWATAGLAQYR